MDSQRSDLARTTLGVLFIGGLTLASFWVLRAFLPAFIWAVMIVVATWPLLRRTERWFGGRRAPAVAVMTVVMLMIFVVPLGLALGAIADHADEAAAWVRGLATRPLPPPPGWVAGLPLVGERASADWAELAASGFDGDRRAARTLCRRRHPLAVRRSALRSAGCCCSAC